MNQIEKKLDNINNSIMSLIKFNYEMSEKSSNNNDEEPKIAKVNMNFNSFFSFKTCETLDNIYKSLETDKFYISQSSRIYKLFYMILKSKLFIFDLKSDTEINEAVVKKIIIIFREIFSNPHNFVIHQEVMKLLLHYLTLSDYECFNVIFHQHNHAILGDFISLINSIFTPYCDIEIEKFKFSDLLKDEKELEKKKMKSPKTIKSEIREKMLMFIHNMFNKFALFNLVSEANKQEAKKRTVIEILDKFLSIFNKQSLEDFKCENEKNRKFFIELLNKFLIKFFTFNKINLENKDQRYTDIKTFVNSYEDYFVEQSYDSIIEVRQCCISILNLILSAFNKSDYYDPFVKSYCKPENFEVLTCLRYLEDENKKINSFFKDFKNIFSILMNLYIDERITFSSLCETSFKLILEKFPIFIFDESLKARNKNQISRVEALDKIFKKYCKA